MPRVSFSEHYRRYQFLRIAWLEFPILYSYLDTSKQRTLHVFYLPSRQLTERELVGHLKATVEAHPELAQRAGIYEGALEELFLGFSKLQGITTLQAGQVLEMVYEEHKQYASGRVLRAPVSIAAELRGKPVRIVVRAIARPEPNCESMQCASADYYLRNR